MHTTGGAVYSNRIPISRWESLLEDEFVRIHRSFLVNRFCLFSAGSGSVVLFSQKELPVSRKYRDAVRSLVGSDNPCGGQAVHSQSNQ